MLTFFKCSLCLGVTKKSYLGEKRSFRIDKCATPGFLKRIEEWFIQTFPCVKGIRTGNAKDDPTKFIVESRGINEANGKAEMGEWFIRNLELNCGGDDGGNHMAIFFFKIHAPIRANHLFNCL